MENPGSSNNRSAEQEREMTESLLLFAKYAIQNAGAHLKAVEMREAVRLLREVERLIDQRRIEVAPPPEPGVAPPDIDW